MSLEDAIEGIVASIRQDPQERLKDAMKICTEAKWAGVIIGNIDQETVMKLEQDGAVVQAVFSKRVEEYCYLHEINLRFQDQKTLTELSRISYKCNCGADNSFDTHFLFDFDRVAVTPGKKRIAYELNSFGRDKNNQIYLKKRELYVVDSWGRNTRRIAPYNPQSRGLFKWFMPLGQFSVCLSPRWIDDDTLEVVWRGYKKLNKGITPDRFHDSGISEFQPYYQTMLGFENPTTDPFLCTINLGDQNKVKGYEFRRIG